MYLQINPEVHPVYLVMYLWQGFLAGAYGFRRRQPDPLFTGRIILANQIASFG